MRLYNANIMGGQSPETGGGIIQPVSGEWGSLPLYVKVSTKAVQEALLGRISSKIRNAERKGEEGKGHRDQVAKTDLKRLKPSNQCASSQFGFKDNTAPILQQVNRSVPTGDKCIPIRSCFNIYNYIYIYINILLWPSNTHIYIYTHIQHIYIIIYIQTHVRCLDPYDADMQTWAQITGKNELIERI